MFNSSNRTQKQKQMKKQSQKHQAAQRHEHLRQHQHPKMNYDENETQSPDAIQDSYHSHLQSQPRRQNHPSWKNQTPEPQAMQ